MLKWLTGGSCIGEGMLAPALLLPVAAAVSAIFCRRLYSQAAMFNCSRDAPIAATVFR